MPRKLFTKKDLIILSCLRRDARMSLTEMSRATQIPVSTIFDRMKSFQGSLVKKHATILEFQHLGFGTRAMITIKTKKECRDEMREYLFHHPHVNSLHRINNGYDFLIEVLFRDLKQLETFFEALEEKFVIELRQVYYIIDDLKREAFLSAPSHVSLVASPET